MGQSFREPVSGFTHLAGAIFSLVALYILILQAMTYGGVWHLVSFIVFGITMLLMFSSSTVYHLVRASDNTIRWLKRVDHMMIFLLIAGTYTPVCLVPLHGTAGWILLAVVWSMALAGIMMKLFWISAPRWLSTLIYLGMGWCIVFAAGPASERIPEAAIHWIVAGGLFYSVGAIIYALRWPNPWPNRFGFHEIWHLFVMAGVFCHFYAVAFGLARIDIQ